MFSMMRLFWLEVKALLRRPVWIFLAAFSAWIFFEGRLTYIYLGLDLSLLGPEQKILSLEEWGRAVLLTLEIWGGIIFSLFVAFLAVGSFSSELSHREVLWSIPGGGGLRSVGAKLMAITTVATFTIILGASTTFLNPSIRETLGLAGGRYVALYLAFAWFRVLLWVALSMFFFYLTRSRWGTIAIVGALQIGWFGAAGVWWGPSLFVLLHRNLVAWNFIGPFAPLGVIPPAFFLQGGIMAGLALALLGAALLLRRRFPEWLGIRPIASSVALALGAVLVVSTGWVTIREIQAQIAPFTAAELWGGKAVLNHPYIWSKDFRLLVYPGEYMAIRLPPGTPPPTWVGELAKTKELRCYDVGVMILKGHLGSFRAVKSSESLVLAYPPGKPYPHELVKAVHQYWREIQPMVDRAQLWLKGRVKPVILWPSEAFLEWGRTYYTNGELLVPHYLLSESARIKLWGAAWALTEASGLDGQARVYLSIYLIEGVDEEQARKALEVLQAVAKGERPSCPPYMSEGFHRYAIREPAEAAHILQYWKQGEEMSHEDLIRSLLEGAK